MSVGNWRLNPPLGVGLICLLLLTIAGLDNQQQQRRAHEHASAQEYGEAAPARAIPTPPVDPRPDREEWRKEYDLQAQRDMARWAFWMVIISGVGVVITGAGVWLVRETLVHTAAQSAAAAAQTEIARKEFRYSRRPIITVTITDDNIEQLEDFFDAPENYVPTFDSVPEIGFELKNVGEGPAIVREFRAQIGIFKAPPVPERESLVFFEWIDVDLLKAGDKFCGRAKRLHEIEPEELIGLGKRTLKLYFSGLIYYTDYAGHGWELGFSFERNDMPGFPAGFGRIREPPNYFDREVESDRSGQEPNPRLAPDSVF